MLSSKLEQKLNDQIKLEGQSSQIYLSMACWADHHGFEGAAAFLYTHSDEERMHMLKLVKYVNNRGNQAKIPALEAVEGDYKSLKDIFSQILNHEMNVTSSINEIIDVCVTDKDHITNNFMQWYVAEQLEEELLARTVLDKLELIGDNSTGIYMFDRELGGGTENQK
jgi:ferritin